MNIEAIRLLLHNITTLVAVLSKVLTALDSILDSSFPLDKTSAG